MTKIGDKRKKSVHNGNGTFSRSRFSIQPQKIYKLFDTENLARNSILKI